MRASSMSEPFEAQDKLKLRPPRSAEQPLAAHQGEQPEMAVPLFYSSHSSRWMPLESFQEAPARKCRWRGKTSGLTWLSQSGTWLAGDSCRSLIAFLVGFPAFWTSSIQRVFKPGQSIF